MNIRILLFLFNQILQISTIYIYIFIPINTCIRVCCIWFSGKNWMEVLSTLGGSFSNPSHQGRLYWDPYMASTALKIPRQKWFGSWIPGLNESGTIRAANQPSNRWSTGNHQTASNKILLAKSQERLFSLDSHPFQNKKSSGVAPQFQVRLVDDNDLTQSGVIFTSKCRNWATNEVCRPQNFEKTEAIDAKNVIKPSCHLTCKCYQHLKELCKCIVSIKMHENAKVYTGALKKTWPKLTQKKRTHHKLSRFLCSGRHRTSLV